MSEDLKIIEVPAARSERVVTPVEYMARFHQVLQALDGTHVRYDEMSDAEGEMVEPLMRLIDTRFGSVRHGEGTFA